jgi:hypothetical protein
MSAGTQHVSLPSTGTRRAMLDTLLRHLPMVRLRVTAALGVALAAAGCVGDITGSDGDSAAVTAAKEKFTSEVQPILDGFCGACHAGSMPNIEFMMANPDPRSQMLGWPTLIDLASPTSSTLLTQGPHTGPAFTPDQAAVMLDWIELEVIAAGGEPAPAVETQKITPVAGVNTVDLAQLGLTGSTLTFLYEPLATGMYLSDLQVNGGTGGVHLVNPLFVIWDEGVAEPDPINRFGNIDLTVLEGTSSQIGGGTAVFVDVIPGSDISVHFRIAEFADGTDPDDDDGGTIGGGCNDVPAFTANAQAALSTNCASCHSTGGMADAIAATDMTEINNLTADGQAAACGQVRTRVNLLDPVNSGLFLAPDPGSGTTHPFKFPSADAFTAFRNQVLLWINEE